LGEILGEIIKGKKLLGKEASREVCFE